MDSLPFWMSAIGFPFIITMIALAIRWHKGAPLPCATDLTGLLIAFDLFVSLDTAQVERYVTLAGKKSDLLSVNLMLVLIGVVFWMWGLLVVEPKITYWYNSGRKKKGSFPFASYFISSWGFFACFLALHEMIYSGGISI